MSAPGEKRHWLAYSESGIVTLLLVLLLALHLLLLLHAGPLWRDEVNTVRMAHLPDLGTMWRKLQYDSFPLLWLLVVRAFAAFGGGSDVSYRLLGFAVGMTIIGALLWNTRRLCVSAPLIALLLLALNPAVIRYGDSMRAYGFGIALFLLTFPLIWKVASQPTRANVIGATLTALLSVHALYYNAVLLLALCAGGAAVAIRHRLWSRIGLLFGVGIISAVSMLPYAGTIRNAAGWNDLVRVPNYDLAWFWKMLSGTINTAGHYMIWLWVALFCVGIAIGILAQIRPHWLRATPRQKDFALFNLTSLLIGALAYFVFLKILSYPTQPWYYVSLIALLAVNLDALLSLLANLQAGRILRLIVVLLAATLAFGDSADQMHRRHTNIDLVAAHIEKEAAKQDFVMVNVWFFGVTFDYYYKGATPWMTVPPIGDHTVHRYDLVKAQMLLPSPADAVRPIIEHMETALKTGHRVWIVGAAVFPKPGETPLAARLSPGRSAEADFYLSWSQHIGQYLVRHATSAEYVRIPVGTPMGIYENVPLIRVEGWRGE